MSEQDTRPPHDRSQRGFDKPAQLTYGGYLKVPELLSLQECLSEPVHHDELQFIVVHQAYELWFKLMLHELEAVRDFLMEGRADDAEHLLRRVHAIEKILIDQVHVLETMTPGHFLGFRDHLRPASGFQSVQFRELEVLSGLDDEEYLAFLRRENIEEVNAAVDRRRREITLRDAMIGLLAARSFDVSWNAGAKSWDAEAVRQALLTIYRDHEPRDVFRCLEALVEHDERMGLWRHHHVALVERQIGARRGTGGSSGAAYLRSTTRFRFFPELWAVRWDLDPENRSPED